MSYDGSASEVPLASKSRVAALSQGDAPLSASLLNLPSRATAGGEGIFDFSVPFRCGGIGLSVFDPADNARSIMSKSSYSLMKSGSASQAVSEDGSVCHAPPKRTMTLGQLVMFTYLAAAGGPCVTPPNVNTVSWC
jgi:hypothetical protein